MNELPRAHGAPALSARIRSAPEDFRVEELPSFAASGSGEHLLLTVEKRGMNTAFAAKRLAQWAGVGEVAIGYAGLKDRHAVTVQRFSVHLPKRVAPDFAKLELALLESDELRVLEHHWHAKKLPRGALAGNRFVLTLREVEGEREAIEQRLQRVAAEGVPNYFGEQRFGRDGDNVANALAMFAGRRVRREQRSLLLSAARSELFNRALAARVRDGSWSGLRDGAGLDGEVWSLAGSRSVFGPEPWSDALAERLARSDIHPSGPLWGRGELRSAGAVRALELAALDDEQALALRAGLEAAGLDQERRALRLRAEQWQWRWLDDGALEVGFVLPAGAYATVVLAELGRIEGAR
ncbi:tRNA pseudouridine(13) synthase TruD [Lysobacter enzymogenes]|uniref:tRNA pseudouridine(13) synthase TruD n=1 Tax=Lysobacter enzymogenes TaxID=69 RepID=UPI001A97562F|nr:tRNA pseudouridine(13) synthase TruD [Lysobacter enzymogenes]QQP96196.1 tRNA pseudouridine(13) synthase TruD [Lysobacter enzymogenes]